MFAIEAAFDSASVANRFPFFGFNDTSNDWNRIPAEAVRISRAAPIAVPEIFSSRLFQETAEEPSFGANQKMSAFEPSNVSINLGLLSRTPPSISVGGPSMVNCRLNG